MKYRTRLARSVTTLALLGAGLLAAGAARADHSIIRNPGQPSISRWEIEPHGILGWHSYYGGDIGPGLGVRASIVLSRRAFVPSINNSVAITFGADLFFYNDCWWRYYRQYDGYSGSCNTVTFHSPVAMQWNFFLTRRWSVFVEPGLALYHVFYDDPCERGFSCDPSFYRGPSHWGVEPVVYVGGRFHFNDHVSLTMRVGYPTTSVGVSFF